MTRSRSFVHFGSAASALMLACSMSSVSAAPAAAQKPAPAQKVQAKEAAPASPASTAAPVVAPAVLAQGGSISVTNLDVLADARQRIPPESRDSVLSRSAGVSQIAGNLYVRRAMAAEAEAAGLGQSQDTLAALQIARDRVLADAWIAKIDAAHQINDAVAEGIARNLYQAKPERFKTQEQVRARHILVAGVTPESRAQAEKLLEELKGGADFAKLAEERSADKGSGAKGGDLGFFERGRMVPAFEVAAFDMNSPGQLSDIIETQFGYHILKFEERKPAGIRSFDEVRADLMKEVRASVVQDARVEEAQRLQKGMTIQQEAVSAFSSTFAPTTIQIAP